MGERGEAGSGGRLRPNLEQGAYCPWTSVTANLPFDLNVCLFIGILLNDRWGSTSLTRGSKLVKQVIIKQRVRILSIALCPVLSASVSGTVSLPSSPVGPSLTSLQLRKPVGQSRLPCLRSQRQCRGCCQGRTPSPERLAGGQMPQSGRVLCLCQETSRWLVEVWPLGSGWEV